jgi:hypothetical protein
MSPFLWILQFRDEAGGFPSVRGRPCPGSDAAFTIGCNQSTNQPTHQSPDNRTTGQPDNQINKPAAHHINGLPDHRITEQPSLQSEFPPGAADGSRQPRSQRQHVIRFRA